MSQQARWPDAQTGFYYYGARYYNPRVSVWLSTDPLMEIAPNKNPYTYCSNNPINRIDPKGLTDFTLDRSGNVRQVGDANDEPDRILKTDRNGNVKVKGNSFLVRKSERGKSKVAVDNIEKGILKSGQNFRTEHNIISVGGEEQPSKRGVEDFALKLSGYIGKEIAGAYFGENDEHTTHVSIGMYQFNELKKSGASGHILGIGMGLQLSGFFHTHPSGGGISDFDRLVPSDADLNVRNSALNSNKNLNFFIITQSSYGQKYPERIDYTTGYSFRRK